MARSTGAKVLVDCLLAQGVDTAFGVPGESYLAVLDALHDVSGRVRMIPNRHEGGAAFMAEAWAKLTGRPGICFVTRGPGATNAAIGVHTAMQAGTPMILFVGQVATDMKGRGAFQEIDYPEVFGGLAKWSVEITSPGRIPEILARAFSVAQSGRPGPVVVALPEDVLSAKTHVVAGSGVTIARPNPDPHALMQVRETLGQAKTPMVLVGGGGWTAGSHEALKIFAETNLLPVLTDFRRQDAFDHGSPCYAGDAGLGKSGVVREMFAESDVILALGSELGEITTDGYSLLSHTAPRQRLIHIHPDAMELNKVHSTFLPIQADPQLVIMGLAGEKLRRFEGWGPRTARLRAGHLAFLETPPQPGTLDMGQVIAHLQAVLPPDAILTNGAGNFAIWSNKHFRFGPRHRLLAPQSGAMGYGLPAAIAAKVAHPDKCVVGFTGDGDFQMTMQELGAAMQTGACPVVLIVNNASYGTIRMHQERTYPGRVSFTDIRNPDFPAIARAYGFHGERVMRTEDFPDAFGRARESATGAVLELVVSVEAITPRQTLADLRRATAGD